MGETVQRKVVGGTQGYRLKTERPQAILVPTWLLFCGSNFLGSGLTEQSGKLSKLGIEGP